MPVSAPLAPPVRVPFVRPAVHPDARQEIERVLGSGWLSGGPEVRSAEQAFAERVSARHVVLVSSCTVALELCLCCLDLEPGTRVVMPAVNFCAAPEVALALGLVPVLCDVDPTTLCATPETVRDAVAELGPVAAVLALHYGGRPVDAPALAAAAGVDSAHVVQDAAHALGATVAGVPVGGVGRMICFSFHASKNLPVGEGGAVATDDGELAERLRRMRQHGIDRDALRRRELGGWAYDIPELGFKGNMGDVQAAFLRAQLRGFDAWQRARAELMCAYDELLRDAPGVRLLPRPEADGHAGHLYVVRLTGDGHRNLVFGRLADRGIQASVHYIPVHHLRALAGRMAVPASLPGCDEAYRQILSLPLYPDLSPDAVEEVASVVRTATG
jgi:dTDP-4-amino-4,6-dideoxygalactose transaminase